MIRNSLWIEGCALAVFVLVSTGAVAQESEEGAAPDTEAVEPETVPKETEAPETAPPPPSEPVIYVVQPHPAPVEPQPISEAGPTSRADFRKLPKKLKPIEGEAPPSGYVEVVQKRRAPIIAGASLFGGLYIFCLAISPVNHNLAIPIAGPMMAGFTYDDAYSDPYAARLYGTFGTLLQTAGVALFIWGISSKKTLWLRQDIAGFTFSLTPAVGHQSGGLGLHGSF